ncbi:MAG: hypothetical protein J6A23_07780 [Thermoguttaceae bacterium]|nr:hypothetical protein [Thermoguttaceae bacterium]
MIQCACALSPLSRPAAASRGGQSALPRTVVNPFPLVTSGHWRVQRFWPKAPLPANALSRCIAK